MPTMHRNMAPVNRDTVTLVILTCPRSQEVVERFVDSYVDRVSKTLLSPVIIIDLTARPRLPGEYVAVLNRLAPAAVYVHPRVTDMTEAGSINDAAFFALRCGLQEMDGRHYLLFLEDDVIFSSQFVAFLLQWQMPSDAGFLTLYLPGGEYGDSIIEPYRFYGTQGVLFPKDSVDVILKNREEMERRFSPNYDMRWAQFLGASGYKLYAAPKAYVQHIGVRSGLGNNFHSSCNFVP